ncbi:OLC1v1038751C1 [Oldenlandia corymbosa var. corymbosa]|uniref:OLC1v1038751C1 n=1 Tax=Oldenlandia corymbosa var. corymbosa TaxID=529605 RepID=A0AAV1D137_OLDCO|nr:OLC1v1038751C1 [Oldenlandia corymbosa var. corymbosa]
MLDISLARPDVAALVVASNNSGTNGGESTCGIKRGAHLRPALYVEVADEPVQDVGEGTSGGQYDGAGSSGVGGTNEDDDDTEDDVHGNNDEEFVPSDESDDDYSDHDTSSVVPSIFDDINDIDKSELDEDSDGITMWDGNWQTVRHGVHFANKKEFVWMPYSPATLADIDPSCSAGSAIWMSQTWLLYFGIREPHIPGRVLRQFGFLQRVPDNTFIMEKKEIEKLHKETRGKKCRDDVLQRWETRHNTLAGLQTDMTLEPQAEPEYLVWYQNRTVTLVTNPSDYRQPQGFQGSAESLHIMANLVQNMRHITLDELQHNPADSWNHIAFLQLHDLTQQAMTVSKTSVWADSENPSQDFVPTAPTQEYIPPRPPRTDRGGFQLGSGRMRKPVATQDTGGQSSTPHVSPYRPASPHHHPSPPFEQMHFDSDFINLDPNAGVSLRLVTRVVIIVSI